MDRSHIITTATGAVTLAVTAPVVIAMTSLISFVWPLIPILTVSSAFLAVKNNEKENNNTNSHAKNNTRV